MTTVTAQSQREAMQAARTIDPRSIPVMPTTPTNVKRDPFTITAESLRTLADLATTPVSPVTPMSPCARIAELLRAVTVTL